MQHSGVNLFTTVLLLLVLSLKPALHVVAQPVADNFDPVAHMADLQAIQSTLESWSRDYAALGGNRNVEAFVSRYYTSDYRGNRSSYKITHRIVREAVTLTDLRKVLERIVALAAPRPTYEIRNFYRLEADSDHGFAVIDAYFSLFDGDKLIAQGNEIQMLGLRRENGRWKISQADILNIVEAQMRSVCGCNIVFRGQSDYTVTLQRPAGRAYTTEEIPFTFRVQPTQDTKVFVANGEEYLWSSTKEVYKHYGIKGQQAKLGKALTDHEVILTILRDKYQDYCRKVLPAAQ